QANLKLPKQRGFFPQSDDGVRCTPKSSLSVVHGFFGGRAGGNCPICMKTGALKLTLDEFHQNLRRIHLPASLNLQLVVRGKHIALSDQIEQATEEEELLLDGFQNLEWIRICINKTLRKKRPHRQRLLNVAQTANAELDIGLKIIGNRVLALA